MNQSSRLKKNQQVTLRDLRTVTVLDKLGEGGQGTVYRVRLNDTNKEKALKWFFIEKVRDPKEFYTNLKENVENGSPSPAFIWPEELTEWQNGTFGYIMELFPPNHFEYSSYLRANTQFASYEAMVNAAINIVLAFKDLHNKGYNYQDLNDGNFTIDPTSGDVRICDNDNVMGHGQTSGILGKARYMAPEVVRGDKRPDKLTDRFSLAIILFMLLVGDHPLEGKKTNVPALTNKYDRRFFGFEPLFIFDEQDDSNRPIEGLHRNAVALWDYYPSYIKKAFQQSFSQESMLNSKNRLLEQVWLHLLIRLKSSIINCPYCQCELFLQNEGETHCIECQQLILPAGYLCFEKKRANIDIRIPIYRGIVLYDYHMTPSSEDFLTQAGIILTKPGKIGLKNLTKENWSLLTPDGKTRIRKPGEVTILAKNIKIDFGNGNIASIQSD